MPRVASAHPPCSASRQQAGWRPARRQPCAAGCRTNTATASMAPLVLTPSTIYAYNWSRAVAAGALRVPRGTGRATLPLVLLLSVAVCALACTMEHCHHVRPHPRVLLQYRWRCCSCSTHSRQAVLRVHCCSTSLLMVQRCWYLACACATFTWESLAQATAWPHTSSIAAVSFRSVVCLTSLLHTGVVATDGAAHL